MISQTRSCLAGINEKQQQHYPRRPVCGGEGGLGGVFVEEGASGDGGGGAG